MTTTDATGVLSLGWLLIAAPLFGAVVLLLGGRRTDKWGHLLGVGMPALSFLVGLLQFITLLGRDAEDRSVSSHLYSWVPAGGLKVDVGFLLDPLSMCFVLLVTFVGTLIHVYSIGYMEHDRDRRRFFGYLNLFVAAMLTLVLSGNFLGLFLGWEGVGLAIIVTIFRTRRSASVDGANLLKY